MTFLSKNYKETKELTYHLEYVLSEFELEIHEIKILNKYKDVSKIEDKIKKIKLCQNAINEQFEVIEKLKKELAEKEILVKKLIAENTLLKNK